MIAMCSAPSGTSFNPPAASKQTVAQTDYTERGNCAKAACSGAPLRTDGLIVPIESGLAMVWQLRERLDGASRFTDSAELFQQPASRQEGSVVIPLATLGDRRGPPNCQRA